MNINMNSELLVRVIFPGITWHKEGSPVPLRGQLVLITVANPPIGMIWNFGGNPKTHIDAVRACKTQRR